MKKTGMPLSSSGRLVVVSLLAAGLLLAGNGVSWADRGDRQGRQDNRYEMRQKEWKGDSQSGKFEKQRSDHRQQKVTVVRELPRGYKTVVIDRTPYYVHEHRYYTRRPGGYALVRPPVGAVFATLPIGSVSLTIGGNFYYKADHVYYRPAPRGYVVAAPPVPAAPAPGGAVMVCISALNVRTGPGEHFPVIGRAWQGETLFVDGHAPGWYYVRLPGGASGWVMSGYTHPLAAG